MDDLLGTYASEDESEAAMDEDQGGSLAVLLGGEAPHDSEGASKEGRVTAAAPAEQGAQAAAAAGLPPGIGMEHQRQQRDGEAEAAAEEAAQEQQQQEQQAGANEVAEEELERLLPEELRQAPEGQCDPAVQARVANWLQLQRTRGRYINTELRKSRGYRNPEFFAKMVEHLEIDQYGTALPPEVFDPHTLPAEDYLEALQKQWQEEAERRQRERAAGARGVEFVKSGSAANLAAAAAAAAVPGGVAPNPLMPGLAPAGAVTATQLAQAQQLQHLMVQQQIAAAQQQLAARQQAAAAAAALAAGQQAKQQQQRPPAAAGGSAQAAAALAAAQAKAAELAARAALR